MESHVVIHNGIDTVASHTYVWLEDNNKVCKRSTTIQHDQSINIVKYTFQSELVCLYCITI